MDTQPRKKWPLWRWTRNVFIVIGLFLVGAVGAGVYEYYRLQPNNHFDQPKVAVEPQGKPAPPPREGVFNVLLLGSDARPGETASHTDSIMVVHVDLNTHRYSVLSIPRDTRVYVPGAGYTKLTSVNLIGEDRGGTGEGIRMTIQTISNLTGVTINYYAMTNYGGLQDMVNELGGITMHVPFRVVLTHPWYQQNRGKVIQPGDHLFDGQMVTELVHERYSLPNGDYDRQRLQEEAIIGIGRTLLQPMNLPKLPGFIQAVPKFLITSNMSTEDMLSLALAVKSFDPSQVKYYQLPGRSEHLYDQVLGAYNDEIVLDPATVRQVVQQFDPTAASAGAASTNTTGSNA